MKAEDHRIKLVTCSSSFSIILELTYRNQNLTSLILKTLSNGNSCFYCPSRYDGLHHGSSYLEHLNFLSAIRTKGEKAPAVDLEDGLISVAIGVAAQLSIELGRFVTIQEVMDELQC